MARILVIEDNPANLELMAYLLDAFAHAPLKAQDGISGLETAHREAPDLILCDLQLPGMDGYEVARQIKRDPALQTVPLIAVTAYAMVGDRDKVLAAGFDGYLTKPIAPETFVKQIEAYLRPAQRSTPPQPYGPATAAAAPPSPKWATILVVDNIPTNVDLLRSILEPSGYVVQTSYQVSEALALARQSLPDLILSDLHMPGENGFDLLRAVKADPQLQHIVVIIHSASVASPKDRAEATALGAAKFIARPIEPQMLLMEVEACLRLT